MRHGKTHAWTPKARPRSLHTVGRAFTAVIFGAASLTAVGLTVAQPAGATTGPVTLATGPAGEPNDVRLDGASSAGFIYSSEDFGNLSADIQYFRRPNGGPAVPLVAAAGEPTLVDTLIGQWDGTTFSFTTIDGSTSGTATPPAGASFLNTSADGYLYSAVPTGLTAVHLFDVNVTAHTTLDLGAVPGNPQTIRPYASTAGVVVATQDVGGLTPSSVYYVTFAAPAHFTQLASSIPLYGGAVLDGTSVAWIENPTAVLGDDSLFVFADSTVVRMGLDGSNPVRTAIPNVVNVALTPTLTGISAENADTSQMFSTMPAAGGALTSDPLANTDAAGSTGTNFIVPQGGTPATAGIYSMASAGGPGTQLVVAGAATLHASTIKLAPSRAIWSDNGIGAGVWTRPLTTSGLTITPGTATVVSPSFLSPTLSASGANNVYIDRFSGAPSLSGPGGPRQVGSPGDGNVTLSGMRLLESHWDGSAVLDDLVTGTSTALPSHIASFPSLSDQPYQLSGDRLAWLASDGSIWVEDLTTSVPTQVSPATVGAGQTVEGSVAIAGDTVAWNESLCSPFPGGGTACNSQPLSYRNFATTPMGPIQSMPSVDPEYIDLSPEYLVYNAYNTTTQQWDLYVNPLYTSTITDVVPNIGGFQTQFSISGSTIGWIGIDKLPHVQALPHISERPRYLSNGIAPAALVADGAHTWNADFVASTNLTTCAVTIKAASATVRTLTCDASQTPFGEALVSWDGKDGGGQLVSAGTYTWTLTGANADGTMTDADGGATALTGSIAVTAASSGGGGAGGGGAGGGSGSVPAGGTVSSNGGTPPTSADPWSVGVTTPVAGDVSIISNPTSAQLGMHPLADLTITAPTATATNPLRLTFQVFLGALPSNTYPSDVQIFRDGVAIGSCPGSSVASPDPCVSSVSVANGVATFTVLSSHASHWQLNVSDVGRLSGADRFATAAAASQSQFAAGSADAVVLARADDYADALVGGPLAAKKSAPLLLTSGNAVPATTLAELTRVLKPGGQVYLLGGTSAIPSSVASQLSALGYQVTRLAGANRYATAVAVADALGDPATVLLATGTNYPDALAAGPAAAHIAGAVLLTNGSTMPAETAVYLAAHATATYAIGGPAAAAAPSGHAIVGTDRYATAVAVAGQFFVAPATVGLATGLNFPDALAAGAFLARVGAPLILTAPTGLPTATAAYLTTVASTATSAHVFGGTSAVSESVRTSVGEALQH